MFLPLVVNKDECKFVKKYAAFTELYSQKPQWKLSPINFMCHNLWFDARWVV